MMLAPRHVNKLGIRAASDHLRVAIRKLAIQLAEAGDFRWTNKREIFRPEEVDLPLAGVRFVRQISLKALFLSVLTVAFTLNSGNLSPTPNIHFSFSLN